VADPLWYPSAEFCAQSSHVGWGAFAVLTTALWWGAPIALLALVAFVAVKEFGFDLVVERDAVLESCLDAGFWMVGAVLGLTAFLLLGGKA
jgi:hypothetical protein